MSPTIDENKLQRLLRTLLTEGETEWTEFKVNNCAPEEIGQYLSALSNAAGLHDRQAAHLVWGVEDGTRRVVGTDFKPRQRKVGNEDLENWLARHLEPRVDFRIHEFEWDGRPVVLFEVQACRDTPVRWQDVAFIRVGSYKKKLRDHPEKERTLWLRSARIEFEREIAEGDLTGNGVLEKIDWPTYFEMAGLPVPAARESILERLQAERMTVRRGDWWGITNLGALLFARRLADFGSLGRKAVRVIVYQGKGRTQAIKEQVSPRGYAAGFEWLIGYINDQLPANEEIGVALRREERMYPEIAIRELVANAIVHQDLTQRGVSPMVEVFSDRVEVSNPGRSLIEPLRFSDAPPRSRNEDMAAFLRRLHICEERGSGVDKVLSSVELLQLPAPEFRLTEGHTIATLFAARKLRGMDRKGRIHACYWHAVLRHVLGEAMTNATLRKRLGIEDQNYAVASRIIADAISDGLVKLRDPENTSKKHASYVPFWA